MIMITDSMFVFKPSLIRGAKDPETLYTKFYYVETEIVYHSQFFQKGSCIGSPWPNIPSKKFHCELVILRIDGVKRELLVLEIMMTKHIKPRDHAPCVQCILCFTSLQCRRTNLFEIGRQIAPLFQDWKSNTTIYTIYFFTLKIQRNALDPPEF